MQLFRFRLTRLGLFKQAFGPRPLVVRRLRFRSPVMRLLGVLAVALALLLFVLCLPDALLVVGMSLSEPVEEPSDR